jgi:hypothetical protein
VLNLGNKRAHCFLEVDRATEANKRWGLRVQAYKVYTESKRYSERYGTKSLRVLTVTVGPKRLANLKSTTEKAVGRGMFWFTTLEQIRAQDLLSAAIWEVAGERSKQAFIGYKQRELDGILIPYIPHSEKGFQYISLVVQTVLYQV